MEYTMYCVILMFIMFITFINRFIMFIIIYMFITLIITLINMFILLYHEHIDMKKAVAALHQVMPGQMTWWKSKWPGRWPGRETFGWNDNEEIWISYNF